MDGLLRKDKICRPSCLNYWPPPSRNLFKVNFDGASRGNLRDGGHGVVCRNVVGVILKNYFGHLGKVTNNFVELECLIHDRKVSSREG